MPSPKAFIIQQFVWAEGCDSAQKLRFQTWQVSSDTLIAHWITLRFLRAQGRLTWMSSKILPFISKYYKCDLMFLEWAVDAVHISLTLSVAHLVSPEASPSSLRAPFPRNRQVPSLVSQLRVNDLLPSISRLHLHASWAWCLPFTHCGTSAWNSTYALDRHNWNSPLLRRAWLHFGLRLSTCHFRKWQFPLFLLPGIRPLADRCLSIALL